jgi:hypothetical protein
MVMSEASARAAVESGRMKAAYGADNKSMGEFLLSDQMRDVTFEVTQDIAQTAGETAHRDNSNKRNVHHYADSFIAERAGGTIKVHRAPRVMCKVVNDDPVALYNEFGNKKSKRRRTLGRAGAAYGDFKPDGGLET